MRCFIGLTILGLGLVFATTGCDLSAMGLDDVSKSIITERGTTGDMLMTQLQTRDQLKDGTGINCPTAKQIQAGQGLGDVLRLRDGSCQE